MAETTVSRNLSEIDARVRELNSSIKSCATDSRALDKALKVDPASIGLASARTEVLQSRIGLTSQKLAELKKKQAEYDAQVKAGLPIDQREYQKLTAQIALTESQTKNLKSQTSALNTQKLEGLQKQFEGVSKAAKALLAILAASIALFVTQGEEIAKNSKALNVNAETYQKWADVFENATGDADNYSSVMNSITTVLAGISKGSTKAVEALASLGLTMEDLNGKTAEEAMNLILEALRGVSDASQRAVLATALLGDSGTYLAQVAGLTSSQIADLNSQLEQNGMLTNDQVTSAETEYQIMNDIKDLMVKWSAEIGSAFLPALKATASLLQSITPLIQGVATVLSAIGPAGQIALVAILGLCAALPNLIMLTAATKVSMDALSTNPIMLAVAAVVAAGAIAGGAAILTSGISGGSSSSYSSSTNVTNNTDQSTIVVQVTTEDTGEDIANKIAAEKKQRGLS